MPILRPSLRRTSPIHGSALVITLLILVLVSIMVIGFADIIRSEVKVSALHEERNQAQLLARMGVDFASDALLSATGDSSRSWYGQPGAVTVSDKSSARQQTTVPLHSGVPSDYNPAAAPDWTAPAEFNVASFSTGETPIVPKVGGGNPVPMPVRWVYVRKDGSLDRSETPESKDAINPLIGRFAYWTDDESTRLNLNTAWKRNSSGAGVSNLLPPNHPSSVSLAALPGFTEEMADQIRQAISPSTDFSDAPEALRFLNSPHEIRRLDRIDQTDTFGAALTKNLFEVTTRNASPDMNIFNEPRIVLTTQAQYAPRDAKGDLLVDENGVPYFLDILIDNTAEPRIGNVSYDKLGKVMNKLISLLKRKDWPMTTGATSFHEKYFNDDVATAQFALDIIEYVRSAESSQSLVEPIRGRFEGSGSTARFTWASVHADSIRGTTRKLFVTEAGCSRKPIREIVPPKLGRFRVRIMYELHLPKNFGIPSIDLTNIDGKRLYFFLPDIYHARTAGGPFMDESGALVRGCLVRLDASDIDGSTTLQAGDYVKVGFTFYLDDFPYPQTIGGRVALVLIDDVTNNKYIADPGDPRIEVAPVWDNGFNFSIKIEDENDPAFATYQVSDPILNGIRHNWVLGAGAPNSWNRPVSSGFSSIDPTSTHRQDVNDQGQQTDIGIRMPSPKGTSANPDGLVRSVGELGYIHTGIQANANKPALKSARFRTLRLQPEGEPGKVPDWALLDLFSAPVKQEGHAEKVLHPGRVNTAGKVNVNSRVVPFGLGSGERPANTDELARLAPLRAVFWNASKNEGGDLLTEQEVDAIVLNLSRRDVATKGATYGTGPGYNMAAEIAEIRGIADHGESSEFLVRSVVDQLSNRGNTYTIYSIGQSLKQTPGGKIVVTAEQRLKAGVERNLDGDVTKLRQTSLEFLVP